MSTESLDPPSAKAALAPRAARPAWLRWVLLGSVVAAVVLVFATGLHRYVSFRTLVKYHDTLNDLVVNHYYMAVLIYFAAYVVTVALSIPGALVFTVTGGFLFGGFWGGTFAVVCGTIGAAIVFMIARTTVGEALAHQAGPRLRRIGEGFRDGAWSYLLFLRFVPVFPFWLVNLAPALFKMSFRDFVSATFLGIIPATYAFAYAGASFGSMLVDKLAAAEACRAAGGANCVVKFEPAKVLTSDLIGLFLALGIISLLPVVARLWRRKSKPGP